MNYVSLKNPFNAFQHAFTSSSTRLQQLFAFFDKSLLFFVFASKIRQLLITSEIYCKSSPLHSELANVMGRGWGWGLRRRKEACCHFAPPLLPLLAKRLGEGWGEGCMLSLRAADPILQTESKGNFESMSLYRHKTLFQPQALRAKKQTFSNLLSLRAAVVPSPSEAESANSADSAMQT